MARIQIEDEAEAEAGAVVADAQTRLRKLKIGDDQLEKRDMTKPVEVAVAEEGRTEVEGRVEAVAEAALIMLPVYHRNRCLDLQRRMPTLNLL